MPFTHTFACLLPAWLLPLGLAMAGQAAAATTWVYEAEGDEAPRRQLLTVEGDRADWLDDAGRTLWRHDTRRGLSLREDSGRLVPVSAAVVDRLAAQLAQARASVPPGMLPRRPRPWAAFEGTNAWVDLGQSATVAGHACQRLRADNSGQAVGEVCVTDPAAMPGGPAVLALLQALDRLDAQLRQRLGSPAGGTGWPWHPLVTAARTGALPLRLVEHRTDEPSLGWRLHTPGALAR